MKTCRTAFCLFVSFLIVVASNALNETEEQAHHRSKRIINGQLLEISKVPYQVAIIWRSYLVCGGSIIAPTWVLTAAHCLYGNPSLEMKVRVGSDRRHIGGLLRKIRYAELYPLYNPKNLLNDAALILVDAPFVFTSQVKCIKLQPKGQFPQVNRKALVSGWGMTNAEADKKNANSFSTVLRFTTVPIMDFGMCKRYYRKFQMLSSMQICAGYQQGGTDACVGDSGGPLVLDQYQIGVVSWGVSCAKPKQPGVYTNVGSVRKWIDEVTQNNTRAGLLQCDKYY